MADDNIRDLVRGMQRFANAGASSLAPTGPFPREDAPEAPNSIERAPEVVLAPIPSLAELAAKDVTLEDVFEHFVGGLSDNTKRGYRRDIRELARWLGLPDDEKVFGGAVSSHVLRLNKAQATRLALAWSDHMLQKGLSPNTRARRLTALRALVRAASGLGIVEWELKVRGPKVQNYRDTRGPSIEIIREMFRACDHSLKGMRDRSLLWTMLTLALRRHEACELLPSHYRRDEKRVRVLGKGGTVHWSALRSRTHAALEEWIARADITNNSPAMYLALNPDPKYFRAAITPTGLYEIVHGLGKKVGADVHPHGLRHAAITLGLVNHDIRTVRLFSRHASVQTVVTYDDNREDLASKVAESIENMIAEGL